MSDRKRGWKSPWSAASVLCFAALLVAGVVPRPAAGVTLEVSSATVSRLDETARLCVLLHTEGKTVAGVQNDLVWDGSCATLPDKDQCQANPGHGKALNAAFPPGAQNTMRAFVLSLSDVNPIPDTELYCCNFRSKLTEQGKCCEVGITRVGASTPDGVSLDTEGRAGRICLGIEPGEAPPPVAAVPSAPAAPGVSPWAVGLVVLAILGLVALVLLRRKP